MSPLFSFFIDRMKQDLNQGKSILMVSSGVATSGREDCVALKLAPALIGKPPSEDRLAIRHGKRLAAPASSSVSSHLILGPNDLLPLLIVPIVLRARTTKRAA